MTDLSVCIVNWNTRDFLDECLASVMMNRSGISTETIVVDNASDDDSASMARERYPEVTRIENNENVGFASANNQAIEIASGRYVLLLNSDTVVHKNAFQKMVHFMDTHTECGALGCKLVNTDGTLQRSIRGFPNSRAALYQFTIFRFIGLFRKHYDNFRAKDFPYDAVAEVDAPMGAALMLRRDALEKTGPLDTSFFMYYEEVDLCRRIKDHGYKIYFLPDAVITHHGGRSARQNRKELFSIRLRSLFTYLRKRQSRMITAMLLVVFVPGLILRTLVEMPGDLVSSVLYRSIKRNDYKAKRSMDKFRAKVYLLTWGLLRI